MMPAVVCKDFAVECHVARVFVRRMVHYTVFINTVCVKPCGVEVKSFSFIHKRNPCVILSRHLLYIAHPPPDIGSGGLALKKMED
jgi:hypothetical protein